MTQEKALKLALKALDLAIERLNAQTKVGCVECGVSGGHAFYCVACSKKLFGKYKK